MDSPTHEMLAILANQQAVIDMMKRNRIISYKCNGLELVMEPRAFDAVAAPVQNEINEKEEDDQQLKHDMDEDILFHSGS